MCPPDHSHATSSTCYTGHACRCDACRGRAAAYKRWRRTVPAERLGYVDVPALVTRRRLQALMVMGWSPAAMSRHLGLDQSLVWRWAKADTVTRVTVTRVAKLYTELAFTKPPTTNKGERVSVSKTKAHAHRMRWAGPLDWDDITNPAEQPDIASENDEHGWVVAELAHLHALGESATAAAAAFQQAPGSLERQAQRHKRPDLAAWIRTAA